jgi:hypothetical protein
MNNGAVTSNGHLTASYRADRKPDLSQQFAHYQTANFALTRERDLARYRTGYSDRTQIYDNSRTVEPSNYFGIKHITFNNPRVLYSPAGMDMVNSTAQTGAAFTKPWQRTFPQNL